MIEADEVIHVGVEEEYMAHAQGLAIRLSGEVAQIEEQRASFEHKLYMQRGAPRMPLVSWGWKVVFIR